MSAQLMFAEYQRVRKQSARLCSTLSAEDMVVQSMPDASPTKWHLAHTSWFFETFVLKAFLPDFTFFNTQYPFLFNSYYESEGERHARPARGMLTRPPLGDIWAYREHVDVSMARLLDCGNGFGNDLDADVLSIIEIGLHHEMQHQELMLTDIKHVLYQNRFNHGFSPSDAAAGARAEKVKPMQFHRYDGGLVQVGHDGKSFSYDCEQPEHTTWLAPFEFADKTVCNADWLAFMSDGAYSEPLLWLSDGWHTLKKQHWLAPLYWQLIDGQWCQFDGHAMRPVDPAAPVCHISYYEAEAFARWAGKRLPAEFEWEHVAKQHPVEGQFLESGNMDSCWLPSAGAALYGGVWEWTQSAFLPYPGFKSVQGALGEYNGKFMVGQHVLRGGSCASPAAQLRSSYRNFFYPHHRWQFSGMRLADTL